MFLTIMNMLKNDQSFSSDAVINKHKLSFIICILFYVRISSSC